MNFSPELLLQMLVAVVLLGKKMRMFMVVFQIGMSVMCSLGGDAAAVVAEPCTAYFLREPGLLVIREGQAVCRSLLCLVAETLSTFFFDLLFAFEALADYFAVFPDLACTVPPPEAELVCALGVIALCSRLVLEETVVPQGVQRRSDSSLAAQRRERIV